jgi:hypothetical protein
MKIIDLGTCKTGFPFFCPLRLADPLAPESSTGVSRDPTTDKDGFYTAPNLLPGTYGITVSAAGFATQVRKGLTLSVGGQSTVNLAPAPTWLSIQSTRTEAVSFVFRILSTWFSRITCCACQSLRTRKQPKDTHGIETVRSRGARHLQ